MRRRSIAIVAVVLATGCGTPATPSSLSASFSDVFAGLFAAQQVQFGRTDVTRSSLTARSTCRRTGSQLEGPGEDWHCTVQYADTGALVTQTFELQVKPDGCWKAEGPPAVQPARLADPLTGTLTTNQLAEFDGCLDTSWR
jgi:hypothetical protein